jgi:ribonuclease BN (tRNA processing enzyme)
LIAFANKWTNIEIRHAEKSMQKLLSAIVAATLIGITALACESVAQTSAVAPTQKTGTRVITLGTLAGPVPKPHRAQSSNLLIVNGVYYVVDAGDGVTRRLAKANINIREVGTIFLTHHHDDHTAGLGTLMSEVWDLNRTKPINVYGPPGTEALVQAAVQYFTASSELRIADGGRTVPIAQVFFGHDVGTGTVFQDANIKVTAIENTHFAFHNGGRGDDKHKSYSYRFETPDRVVVFTGDTGLFDGLIELAKGADLLVSEANSVEARKQILIKSGQWQAMTPAEQERIMQQAAKGHLSPEDVGKVAARAGVKTVVLTHLTALPDGDDYTPWADEVKKSFPGQVLIARDLMEF